MYIFIAKKTNTFNVSLPQRLLGQCVNSAPVAFLKNFKVSCVTQLQTCPSGSPLRTPLTDLRIQVKNGRGGVFCLLNALCHKHCFKMSCSSLNPCVLNFSSLTGCVPGNVVVDVIDEVAVDSRQFISNTDAAAYSSTEKNTK